MIVWCQKIFIPPPRKITWFVSKGYMLPYMGFIHVGMSYPKGCGFSSFGRN